jgi:hypothetical protein
LNSTGHAAYSVKTPCTLIAKQPLAMVDFIEFDRRKSTLSCRMSYIKCTGG